MKKSYLKFLLMMAMFFVAGISVHAQSAWNSHSNDEKVEVKRAPQNSELSEILVGHCTVYDQIYPYDGLSLDSDARVGVGIVLPREIIGKYVGGIITAMYVGWDDESSTSEYECFIRKESFNAANYASGNSTVQFGWNRVELNQVPVPDVDRLCIGFYTDVKKDVCSIPKLYPWGVPNSVFLHSGETTAEGDELWYDMHKVEGMGIMPIMLVISDRRGVLIDMIEVTGFRSNTIVWRDDVHDAKVTIKNVGSNAIESLKISSTINDMTMGDEDLFELEEPIVPSDWITLDLPVYCLGSGVHDIAITEINGREPKRIDTLKVDMIGVPWDIEGKYIHKPVVEYFCSEEEYKYPRQWEKMFWPGFKNYEQNFTIIQPHLDDKYMTGDNDALMGMLALVDNDSANVWVPAFTINRQDNMSYLAVLKGTIFHNGTPYPEAIGSMYSEILLSPTFASVEVNAKFSDDFSSVNVEVSGVVEDNVMAEGEPLFLTVYLMERNVRSFDQLYWDEEDANEHADGMVHKCIIRDVLTDYWGDQLEQTGGNYSQSFAVELDHEWNTNNLYIAAFLNRSIENTTFSRNIINSAEGKINYPDAVYGIESDEDVNVVAMDGKVYINGSDENVQVYNLAGVRFNNASLAQGIYLVKKDNIVAKVFVR